VHQRSRAAPRGHSENTDRSRTARCLDGWSRFTAEQICPLRSSASCAELSTSTTATIPMRAATRGRELVPNKRTHRSSNADPVYAA